MYAFPTADPDALKLQKLLDRMRLQSGVPGICASVWHHGRMISAACGTRDISTGEPLSVAHRFGIGCFIQLPVSVLILQEVAKGRVDLRAPIATYIPDLARTGKGVIPVAAFLSHTSGYQGLQHYDDDLRSEFTWLQLLDCLANAPQIFVPGTVINYHSADFVVLGELLRRITGRDAIAEVDERALRPMLGSFPGVQDSADAQGGVRGHEWHEASRRFTTTDTVPLADLWHTATSPALMSTAQLNAVLVRIAQCEFADQMLRHRVAHVPRSTDFSGWPLMPTSFGFGTSYFGRGLTGYGGIADGQCCAVRIDLEREVSIAVAINAPVPQVRDLLMIGLFRAFGSQAAASPLPPDEAPRFSATEIAGMYAGGTRGCEIDVRCESNTVEIHIRRPLPGITSPPAPIRAQLDPQGVVRAAADSRHRPFCFFRDPVRGTPCVMLGAGAYARAS